MYSLCAYRWESTEAPINVFSSWILFNRYFLTILIMVTEQLYWRKILCGCFRSLGLWLLLAIMKRCAERCALQLYRTSLNCYKLVKVFRYFYTTILSIWWQIPFLCVSLSNYVYLKLYLSRHLLAQS